MLDIRQGLAKTSTEKFNAMLRTACPDGRIRSLTQFCGAARTGRWAGRLVQMQNLPQNKMPDKELDCVRQLVRRGDLETLELLFDDTAGTLSQLIRTAFIPKPGCRFIVADFSAIEARVIAWLSGEALCSSPGQSSPQRTSSAKATAIAWSGLKSLATA